MTTSEASPSPEYRAAIHAYARLHLDGDPANGVPAEKLFDGRSLVAHIEIVRQLCRRFKARRLLDYGCGKAQAYSGTKARTEDGRPLEGLQALWDLDEIAFYDPALVRYAELPTGRFDAAVATAVLEYTPEADLDWVLSEILGYAERFVFLSVACYASDSALPDGRNYHATVASPGWWTDRILGARRDGGPRIFAMLYDTPRRRVMVDL